MLTASLERGVLVLTTHDGTEHSRLPVADEDALAALARIEAGDDDVRLLVSLDALDAALSRNGYQRTSEWSEGLTGGPVAEVTC